AKAGEAHLFLKLFQDSRMRNHLSKGCHFRQPARSRAGGFRSNLDGDRGVASGSAVDVHTQVGCARDSDERAERDEANFEGSVPLATSDRQRRTSCLCLHVRSETPIFPGLRPDRRRAGMRGRYVRCTSNKEAMTARKMTHTSRNFDTWRKLPLSARDALPNHDLCACAHSVTRVIAYVATLLTLLRADGVDEQVYLSERLGPQSAATTAAPRQATSGRKGGPAAGAARP